MKKLLTSLSVLIILSFGLLHGEGSDKGLYLDNSISASLNYLGLQFSSKLYYRLPILRQSNSVLFGGTKMDFGIRNDLTPSYNYISAYINVNPIAVFDITASAGIKQFYPALGYGFISSNGYSLDTHWSGDDAPDIEGRSKGFLWLNVYPSFRMKVKRLIFLHYITFSFQKSLDGDEFNFYDQSYAQNIMSEQLIIKNESILIFQINDNFMTGLYNTHQRAKDIKVSGEDYSSDSIYAMAAFEKGGLGKRENMKFNAGVLFGTWISDRYLKGKFSFKASTGLSVKLF